MIDRLIVNVLAWAAGHADEGRYSPVAIVFHWTMALLAFFQLGWGWWMGRVAVGGVKLWAYEVHFAVGLLMLVLALGRTSWRLLAPGPVNDADKPGWESTAAHVTHYIFYLCLFGLPLSGWAMVSATAPHAQFELLGFIPWPRMPVQTLSNSQLWRIEAAAEWMHWGLILALLLLVPVHAAAALKHHFVDREDVLHAMLPVIPDPEPRPTRWRRRFRAVELHLRKLAMPRSPPRPRRSRRRRPAA